MDILKIVVIIIGALLIVYLGVSIRNKYKRSQKVLCELISIVDIIEIDIAFSKKNIKQILTPQLDKLNKLKHTFESYLTNSWMNFNLLDEQDNREINEYFNMLGECDVEIELNKCQSFKNKLLIMQSKYNNLFNNNGQLAFRLSICCSLVFIILFA